MLRFIAGIPRGLGKEVFLLNTRAGMKRKVAEDTVF
jgi:hypothetical protein